MKTRDPLFDYLKGFAIVLVVLGHSLQTHLGGRLDDNFLFRFIYSFHMPLFMFISGYLSYASGDGSIHKLFLKTTALVVPFISWFIFSFFLSYFQYLNNGGASPDFIFSIKKLFEWPDNGLWFLWILFLNHILLFLARKTSAANEELVLFFLFIIINLSWQIFHMDYLGIGLLKWHLLFFLLGYVFNKRKQPEHLYKWAGLVSCIIFPILVMAWRSSGFPVFYTMLNLSPEISNIVSLIYNYVVAISGILAIYTLFKRTLIFDTIVKRIFVYLGPLTLEIYCCHAYFLNLLNTQNFPFFIRVIVSFILGLSLSLILQAMVKKIPILPFILYGKKQDSIQQ